MAVVIKRSTLTEADKAFIRNELTITSNADPPVVVKPFIVQGDDVRIPMAFYRELREQGNHLDWPEFPNDEKHKARFSPEYTFKGNLRPYQQEAWQETLAILKGRRTALISAHTGWGKSCYASFLSFKAQLVTLILYHIAPLGRSWPTTFENTSTATVCHIGKEPFNPHAHIYIATVGSALSSKFPLNPDSIGMLIVDEAHAFASPKRIFSLLKFTPKYLLNLTATINRADGMGKMLGLFHGRHKLDDQGKIIPGQLPFSMERISKRSFTVYKCQTQFRPRIKSNQRGLDWQEVKNSLLPNKDPTKSTPQSKLIVNLICDWAIANPHKKILITCIEIAQLKAISSELISRGEKVATMYGSDATYEDKRILVAGLPKVGLGFDIQNTATNWDGRQLDLIILGWTIKDKSVIEQVVGRMRGADGTVVDICHHFTTFEKHFQNRTEWYLSRSGVVKEAHIPCRLD